jgi:hypothetical protein
MAMRSTRDRRRTHRWGVAGAIGISALIHAAVLLGSPDFRVVELGGGGSDAPRLFGSEVEPRWNVLFGPPTIFLEGGRTRQEPPGRTLHLEGRDVGADAAAAGCALDRPGPTSTWTARLRLELDAKGQVQRVTVAEGTGDACVDATLTALGQRLRYLWLPDPETGPRVELVQPVEIEAVS